MRKDTLLVLLYPPPIPLFSPLFSHEKQNNKKKHETENNIKKKLIGK